MIAAANGTFTGCCFAAPPPPPPQPPDYSSTPSCGSGAAREVFSSLLQDPCRDECLGMCGPGCSPWLWVCGDEAVHAACWNHDSAYCPATFDVYGVDVPNPDYPFCEEEFLAYTAEIGTDTVLGTLCDNDALSDEETAPWPGLWTIVPTFFAQYKNPPTLLNSPSANYWSSSELPGYDSWPHGAAQAGDHVTASYVMDGNFFDGTVFHSDFGYLASSPQGAPPGQWWAVDLGAQRNIGAITIYNRTDYWNYPNGLLNNFQVLTWNGSTWTSIADDTSFIVGPGGSAFEQPPETPNTAQLFVPPGTTSSQFVLIAKTDDNALVLGDVEIWGY